ncbi:hypothetical protein FQZ97_1012150 [compost metagenome]
MAFPFRLQRRDVDDDAAARVGALAQADGQHIAGNAEVFHGAGQGEGVRRDDADVAVDVDEALLVEVLRVHHGRMDVGEHLEFGGAAHVVAIAGNAVGDHPAVVRTAHLALDERLDHAVLQGHAANPLVRFDGHGGRPVRG